MKTLSKTERLIFAVAGIAALLFSFLLWDDSLLDLGTSTNHLKKIGVLIEIENDVRQKISQEYSWRNLKKGKPVYQGDSIFSGERSRSAIQLADGSQIEIHENSLLILNMVDGNLDLNLNFGQVSTALSAKAKVRLNSCGQAIEVDADEANSAFDLTRSNGCKQKVEVKVTSGKLAVNGNKVKKSQSAILRKGKRPEVVDLASLSKITAKAPEVIQYKKTSPSSNDPASNFRPEKPLPPVALEPQKTPSPIIQSPKPEYQHVISYDDEGKVEGTPYFAFKWTHPNQASFFTFQISDSKEFSKIISERYAKGLASRSPDLKPGRYYLRVKEYKGAKDKTSTWSEPVLFSISEKRSELKLAAPILEKRLIDFRAIEDQTPQLKWKPVAKADHYVVTISNSKRMKDLVAQVKTTSTDLNWDSYQIGNYFYQIQAISKEQKPGKASVLGKLQIVAEKPVVEPVPARTVRTNSPEEPAPAQDFEVKWSHLKAAETYRIEVSETTDFKNPKTFLSRSPASLVNIEKPGEYKWRVQPLDSKNKPITDYSNPGELKFAVDIPLVQPKLIEPAGNLTLFFQKNFSAIFWVEWTPVLQAKVYDVEMSSNEDFKDLVLQEETKNSRFLIKKQLPPGDIYWRIRARGDGKSSNWSETRRLKVFAGQAQSQENK